MERAERLYRFFNRLRNHIVYGIMKEREKGCILEDDLEIRAIGFSIREGRVRCDVCCIDPSYYDGEQWFPLESDYDFVTEFPIEDDLVEDFIEHINREHSMDSFPPDVYMYIEE